MGQEIEANRFKKRDYRAFMDRLKTETGLLHEWLCNHTLSDDRAFGGFEQEAWLVDSQYKPAPINELFLSKLNSPLVTPELAKFNIELNVDPLELRGNALSQFHEMLNKLWSQCVSVAQPLDARVVMIGVLPSVSDEDLILDNMSSMNRYRALNEQVLNARKGNPLHLDIVGHEHLKSIHHDVMLESAATSFQVHRQVPALLAENYYNAALLASAPLVAVSANSPYVFGKQLWEESRIPLFEQAVAIGGYGDAAHGPVKRVTFGTGYNRNSIFECFDENLAHYPVLLPVQLQDDVTRLPYLRLHNGTIWRWNRPLIGFDAQGRPHVRIEHRVIAAGPTIVDEIANAAFFYGLQEFLATQETPPEQLIDFSSAKDNFYNAARLGLNATTVWHDTRKGPIQKQLSELFLPMARRGLEQLEINRDDIDFYLGVIHARIKTQQTGAYWQKRYVATHHCDMQTLTAAYLERQQQGNPVHEWLF